MCECRFESRPLNSYLLSCIIFSIDSTLGKVSFGTSTDRHIFPVDTPKSRFGCSLKPIRGTPQLGPGCYNNDEVCFSKLLRKFAHKFYFIIFLVLDSLFI